MLRATRKGYPERGIVGGQGSHVNADGSIKVEDDLDMVVPFKIGGAVTGTTRKGYVINSSYPNDQRLTVYFHRVPMANGSECWEYWTYYGDNYTPVDRHEHDWEFYFVYLRSQDRGARWVPLY